MLKSAISMEEKMTETGPTNKFGNACIKALLAEEMSKEEDQKHQISGSPAQSELFQTESIHHFEPPIVKTRANSEGQRTGFCVDNTATSAASMQCTPEESESDTCHRHCKVYNPMLGHNQLDEQGIQLVEKRALLWDKLMKGKEEFLMKKVNDIKDLGDGASTHQTKKFLDALEIFNVNKDLFFKILQDPDSALASQFRGVQASRAKTGLTKSGSFPLPGSVRKNFILLMDQKEIGPSAKRESKLHAGIQTAKLSKVESSSSDDNVGSILKPEDITPKITETCTGLDSSLGSPHELKKRGESQVVLSRFQNIKKKIKQAIKESKKERLRISMDAILHKIPYGRRSSKDVRDQWKEFAKGGNKVSPKNYESNGPLSSICKGNQNRMRRTVSLNESLNRYSQLFESSYGKEAKQQFCDRLKVTNDGGCSPRRQASKTFGRILSMPNIEYLFSLQNDISCDIPCLGMETRNHADESANIDSSISDEQKLLGLPTITEDTRDSEVLVKSESQENLVQESESISVHKDQVGLVFYRNDDGNTEDNRTSDNMDDIGDGTSISLNKQEVGPKLAQPSPVSALDSCFQEDVASPAKFITEDSEFRSMCTYFDNMDSSVNLQNHSAVDSSSDNGNTVDLANAQVKNEYYNGKHVDVNVDRKDESEFNYVRDVLKLSGFSGNEYLGTWYSPDQPVDPSLFEEIEICSPRNYSRHGALGSCDYQLLFDLINEVLLEIYGLSLAYWPHPLSSNSHIRPMPVGHHVLEEVWSSVSWYLKLQPELDPSLDYIVSRDLAKSDGWMNLQFDIECVGLELEEWILDDLLDEVTYS
ncbi:PREDICTED: uncharacterized protein LOC104594546 isoform X2 [Nelumbo nucifera]|uniref:Uncharacterized protein LOC104594546 isoform X2 n=1 Tax=Nelumbo nucifera TaxID=4432 RepID=A0A1U7ZHA2_NELNU|nr:PREDICTED: uncharacterized protein LOC104594546 isoform X2 [Nelumbo nucifera]